MSYEPTVWNVGDTIAVAKLNKLEQGVAEMSSGYTPTVWVDGDEITAQKMNRLEQAVANSGGGSSDFSTAEVTINVNLPEGETVETIEASIGFGSLDQLGIYTGTTVADANNKISIIMYKGSGYIESIHVLTSESNYTFYSNFTTASGDVVWDSNVGFYGGWNVTGDGSLTTTFPYPEDND